MTDDDNLRRICSAEAATFTIRRVLADFYALYRGDFLRAAGCGIGAGGPKNKYLPICVISPAFCLKIQLEIDFHPLF